MSRDTRCSTTSDEHHRSVSFCILRCLLKKVSLGDMDEKKDFPLIFFTFCTNMLTTFLCRTKCRQQSDWRLEADKEPDTDLWKHGDCQRLLKREIIFQTLSKERFFFSFIALKATEKCSSRLKGERDRGGGIDYQYFCGTRRQFITDSQKWSLSALNECTSLRLGERIKMLVWSVLQDKVRTGREVGRRVQMSKRATQSQNKTRNWMGKNKCKACLVCILLLLLSQLQQCHLQVFIRFLLN